MMVTRQRIILFILICISLLSAPWTCKKDERQENEQEQAILLATVGIEEARREEEKPYQFSDISSICCDSVGNIYVLDRKDVCIKIFDSNGSFLRKILQKGQGPNEIENPVSVVFNKYSGNLFVLHKYGLQIKEFDKSGYLVQQYNLPEQMNKFFDFIDEIRFLIVARHFPGEHKYHNFNEVNLETVKIEKELIEIERSEMSNAYQMFIVKDGNIWTCPGDRMELVAYDFEAGDEIKKISIEGDYKELKILKGSDDIGNYIIGMFFNYAQPVLISDDIYVLIKRVDYKDESRESRLNPIIREFSLYRLEFDSLVKKIDLSDHGHMELGTAFKNLLILYARDPFPHFKILKIVK
jgi:hypothetical protein